MAYLQNIAPKDCPDRPISTSRVENGYYTGRRLRAFMCLVNRSWDKRICVLNTSRSFPDPAKSGYSTYRSFYEWLHKLPFERDEREVFSSLNPINTSYANLTLTEGLQDLADAITIDIVNACKSFDNKDFYYPGVYEGIEPVTDDHIRLVISSLQRELKREKRELHGYGSNSSSKALPAAPLDDLPWNIQRALVERRRLRYTQWGITAEMLHNRMYSLFDIPEDQDYLPTTFLSWQGSVPAIDPDSDSASNTYCEPDS